eukprot:scaffold7000_cov51-Isochrysis_galbana.AAC.1
MVPMDYEWGPNHVSYEVESVSDEVWALRSAGAKRSHARHLLSGLHVPVCRLEGLGVAEPGGVEDVEDGPELGHVVLQRSAREQQLVRR